MDSFSPQLQLQLQTCSDVKIPQHSFHIALISLAYALGKSSPQKLATLNADGVDSQTDPLGVHFFWGEKPQKIIKMKSFAVKRKNPFSEPFSNSFLKSDFMLVV